MSGIPDVQQPHPGLLLEKWHEPWQEGREDKEFAKKELLKVVAAKGDEALLAAARRRYEEALKTRGAVVWTRRTASPLALHLAASGSFENAGLCLHPIYGFAYIPGSGLKGMARAFAATVAKASRAEIEAVFGPEADEEKDAAGEVVFHDAWPVKWPKLALDIVNNHHRDYYEDTGDKHPPEDWENPVPVNFLTVAPGAEFSLAISLRRRAPEKERLLKVAREWLDGALTALGAGAKTNAGYGRFAAAQRPALAAEQAEFTCTLELVSPAFLAGAAQGKDDCVLRGATLRGLLRSWWRTIHAGLIPVAQLRTLEGQIWGTTEAGSAISLEVESAAGARLRLYDREAILRENGLRRPEGRSSPGVWYLAYGMEGNPGHNRPARHYVVEGSKWQVRVVAKARKPWQAQQILDQALAALHMLVNFGGVGAKSRRGMGSLDFGDPTPAQQARLNEAVNRVRTIHNAQEFKPAWFQSPSLQMMAMERLPLGEANVWRALNRLGETYQAFAAAHKHKREKAALGLPRAIHRRPNQEQLKHPAGKHPRHASPLLFKLIKTKAGYAVQVSAWYSPHLPDWQESKRFLDECVEFMRDRLTPKEKKHG